MFGAVYVLFAGGAFITLVVGLASIQPPAGEDGRTRRLIRSGLTVIALGIVPYFVAALVNRWHPFGVSLALQIGLSIAVLVGLVATLVAARKPSNEIVAQQPDDAMSGQPASLTAVPAGLALVQVSMEPRTYRDYILEAEADASEILRIPKRVSAVFKSDAGVLEIATRRFGEGSDNIEFYLDEHRRRRTSFLRGLEDGLECREIYNRAELEDYFENRNHTGSRSALDVAFVVQMIDLWMEALTDFDQYRVALTSEPLPLKYQVVDREMVSIHEAVRGNDVGRMNGVFIRSHGAAGDFVSDFNTIWDRTPHTWRDNKKVLAWLRKAKRELEI